MARVDITFGTVVKGFQRIDVVGNPNVMIWLEPYRDGVTFGLPGDILVSWTLFVPRILALPEHAS